jgi:hypothetical protein
MNELGSEGEVKQWTMDPKLKSDTISHTKSIKYLSSTESKATYKEKKGHAMSV